MTKYKFENNYYSAKKLWFQKEWESIDLQLDFHKKLIDKIPNILEKEFEDLSFKYKETLKRDDIDENHKEHLINEIEWEGHNFELYNPIYINSLYINIYAILENHVFFFTKKYCKNSFNELNKGKYESYLSFYTRIFDLELDNNNPIRKTNEFHLLNSSYRTLRNCLVHNRYVATENQVRKLKSLLKLTITPIDSCNNEFRVAIKEIDLVSDFLAITRNYLKGLYSMYNNKIYSKQP